MEVDKDLSFDDRKGKICLPSGVPVIQHVAARIRELRKLYNDITTTKSEMLVHQMLPNHMRRRAMSHNPKRLPLKYRQIHMNQMSKSGPNVKKSRPSRKYRRKPSNLMKEYERRTKKFKWLETHIWHAKRFHMKELWGYKIPFVTTDKRYRANYKAAANHCLVHDLSFFGGIEISGNFDYLGEKFELMTSKDCGLTLMAKCYQKGCREGHIDLFKINQYPYGALARVSFMWKPSSDKLRRTLWMFVHPTAYQEVLEELVSLFELQNVSHDERSSDPKITTKNDSFQRNPKYKNEENSIEVIELRDTLNRFRLTGPYSNAVIHKSLKPCCDSGMSQWMESFVTEDEQWKEILENQEKIWKTMEFNSPSEFSPFAVIGLNIVDPRTNRPAKRENSKFEQSHVSDLFVDALENISQSPIWNKEFRDNITKSMMTTAELQKLRNQKQLVPGTASIFETKLLQPVPILLIQRPGSSSFNDGRLGLGAGWDIIVPAGYGMSVWLSLLKCGSKPGGWRDILTFNHEVIVDTFLPDTVSGLKESSRNLKLKRDEYFKKPPNKRTNYRKMSITSPFSFPFVQLVKEWGNLESEKFYVLRNRKSLENIKELLKNPSNFHCDFHVDSHAVIPIKISINARGTPGDFGILCLPRKRDIKRALTLRYQHSQEPILIEPDAKDPCEKERKLLRFHHKKLLKRLRNRRVRMKRKLQATATNHVTIPKSTAEKIIEAQFEKNCELVLPMKATKVRNQCSRETIGYITMSSFSLSEGRVGGIGYITWNGLIQLIAMFKKFKGLTPFVLRRASNSKCYNSASIGVRLIV
ncbi:CLUMA_CG000711, isoform A [Clunio marinus]|uniref:CLUMA_CG000711, isoform A n=1 Tax=Clunio marinus TaxID=568069 RepID=A0A1J1HK97_9DIPT|nr:CLUMA_CG000711, isoform A [Clunio marinus]